MRHAEIYHRDKLTIADDLMTFQKGLVDDFMKGHTSIEQAIMANCVNTIQPKYINTTLEEAGKSLASRDPVTKLWKPNLDGWKSTLIRNLVKDGDDVVVDETISEVDAKRYPTAMRLLEKYKDSCYGLVYSAIAPYTILHRHTGPENIEGRYVRIHIPLIIPQGDLFIEIANKEVTWDDIFGFSSQDLHSAHNYSNEWRLIMIMDMDMEAAGLPPGTFYDASLYPFSNYIRGIAQ